MVDVLGNTLRTFQLDQEDTSIDLAELPHGLYFVRIGTAHGTVVKKLVVR